MKGLGSLGLWAALVLVVCVKLAGAEMGAGEGNYGQVPSTVSYAGHRVLRFDLSSSSSVYDADAIAAWAAKHGGEEWARSVGWIDVQVPPDVDVDAEAVTGLGGRPYRVLIADLDAELSRERAQIFETRLSGAAPIRASSTFFDTYRTWDEFNAFLDSLASEYPHLVTKKTIGKTVEGRSINGITIASPNNSRSVGIVFNGGQHAREWISPMTNAFLAYQLISLYGKDAEVTKMVDEIEWSIFPILNGDGYVYTWTTNRMWRKNRRYNADSWFGCYGVDTNRNWDYKWNTGGSSGDTCSDTYHGPKPFSEPEITSLVDYIRLQRNVKGYIDIHSYSQLWMSPCSWTTKELPKDYTTQNDLSKLAVAAIKATHGVTYQYGPSAQTIYVASGSAPDWTYGAMNVTWSYVVELRDTGRYGFVLPASEIVPTGQEMFAAVRVMANYILARV